MSVRSEWKETEKKGRESIGRRKKENEGRERQKEIKRMGKGNGGRNRCNSEKVTRQIHEG